MKLFTSLGIAYLIFGTFIDSYQVRERRVQGNVMQQGNPAMTYHFHKLQYAADTLHVTYAPFFTHLSTGW